VRSFHPHFSAVPIVGGVFTFVSVKSGAGLLS
jgi:hypothetical protein